MVVDHRLLKGVELAVVLKAFDGDDVGAVELSDDGDAGGEGLVTQVTIVGTAGEDRAGAAVAFGADDLGAGFLEAVTEERGKGKEEIVAADFEAAAVDVEQGEISHGGRGAEIGLRVVGRL